MRIKQLLLIGMAFVQLSLVLNIGLASKIGAASYSYTPITSTENQKQFLSSDGGKFIWREMGYSYPNGTYGDALFYFNGTQAVRITNTGSGYYSSVISGEKVAYLSENTSNNTTQVFVYDAASGNTETVSSSVAQRQNLTFAGNRIAWSEGNGASNSIDTVWVYDLGSNSLAQITNDTAWGTRSTRLQLTQTKLYWAKNFTILQEYDFANGVTNIINAGQYISEITADVDNVVWTAYDSVSSSGNTDTYLYKDGLITRLSNDTNNDTLPKIKGQYIVWGSSGTTSVVNSYNILTGINEEIASDSVLANTDGRYIIYSKSYFSQTYNTYLSEPYVKDMQTGETTQISIPGGSAGSGGGSLVIGDGISAWIGNKVGPNQGIYSYRQVYVAREGVVLSAPIGLAGALITNQSPAFTWNPVFSATSYDVYRSGLKIASTSDTSFTDSSIQSPGTYAYTVQACLTLCSSFSTPISIVYDTESPIVGAFVWTSNPKAVQLTSTLVLTASDSIAGIAGGEYFIGDNDPGEGNGATMNWDGTNLGATFGTDFPTGVYKISVRAQDNAGNWSAPVSDYLVVYNPDGPRFTGKRSIIPSLANGDLLTGLIANGQTDKVKFGFSVKYNNQGQISANSDLQFSYETGTRCNNPARAENCHSMSLNAANIAWMTTQGTNSAEGVFQGTATMTLDGVQSQVTFRVTGLDGERLDGVTLDRFQIQIFNEGVNPNTGSPVYLVNSADILRGNIKVIGGDIAPPPVEA